MPVAAASTTSTIITVLRVLVWALACVKLFEILMHIRWMLNRGGAYREDVIRLVGEARGSRELPMEKLQQIDANHQVPFISFWLQPLFDRPFHECEGLPSRLRMRWLRAVAPWLDRQPTAILSVTGMLALFPDRRFAWVEISLVLVMIYMSLASLILSRAILGFVDNFRADLSVNPLTYYQQKSLNLSRSGFVRKFLIAVVAVLLVSVIGFAGAFFGVYTIYGKDAFHNLRTDLPPQVQLVYFSLLTLATVSYGDIQPGVWAAQAVAALEIAWGMGLLVFLLFALSNTFALED